MLLPPQHLQLEISLEHQLLHRVAGLLHGQPVLQHLQPGTIQERVRKNSENLQPDADAVLAGLLLALLLLALLLLLLLVLRGLDRLVPQPAHLPLLRLLRALVALGKQM